MKEVDKIQKNAPGKMATSKVELRKKLTPEQFHVTQEHGTERAFSHRYYKDKRDGMYRCVVCGAPLFSSGKVRFWDGLAELHCCSSRRHGDNA